MKMMLGDLLDLESKSEQEGTPSASSSAMVAPPKDQSLLLSFDCSRVICTLALLARVPA